MPRAMVAAAALVFVLGHSASAQQPAPAAAPQATGVIAGQLTTDGGQPLRKATDPADEPATRTSRTTTSDGEGRYSFTNLAAGEYVLTVSKPGYLEMVYGARRAGPGIAGIPIKLAANQKLEKIDLVVPRGSVIAGTVLDEFGDPAFNTPVRALRVAYQNGGRTLMSGGNATTDDRGDVPARRPDAGRIPGERDTTRHGGDGDGAARRPSVIASSNSPPPARPSPCLARRRHLRARPATSPSTIPARRAVRRRARWRSAPRRKCRGSTSSCR